MFPVVFEEFQMVYNICATFFFSPSLSIGKRSTLAKIWGAAANNKAFAIRFFNCKLHVTCIA